MTRQEIKLIIRSGPPCFQPGDRFKGGNGPSIVQILGPAELSSELMNPIWHYPARYEKSQARHYLSQQYLLQAWKKI